MSIKMKELPLSERPYEKLQMYGPEKLSNAELLAIIIKTGTKTETSVEIAQKILKLKGEQNQLKFLQDVSIEECMQIKGIGKVKAIQIRAIGELTKRMARPINSNQIKITNSIDVANLMMEELRYEKREIAKVILLNAKNMVLKIVDIAFGGANFAMIEPKEVLSEAIKMNVPNIILIHNHPSGDATPSNQDYHLTDRIYDCCDLMGIKLLDHIVIGDGTFSSIMTKTKDRKYKK